MTDLAVGPDGPACFRAAMRHMAHTVSIVTAIGDGGRTGCTVSSIQSFSVDPPMLLVCLRRGSSTAQAVEFAGSFGVSVLDATMSAIAHGFTGFDGTSGADRFAGGRWSIPDGGSAPLLEGALVAMTCRVEEILPRHTHLAIFGRVLHLSERTAVPLVYWQGRFGRPAML